MLCCDNAVLTVGFGLGEKKKKKKEGKDCVKEFSLKTSSGFTLWSLAWHPSRL